MDVISGYDLQGYETILEEINTEHEKSERLRREIDLENDKIIAFKLSVLPSKKDLCDVKVKIFNEVPDILILYPEDSTLSASLNYEKSANLKYYVVEVNLPKAILQRFLSNSDCWKIQVCVITYNYSTAKTLKITNKSPLVTIFSLDHEVKECILNTCLYFISGDDWNTIDLNTTKVDISYHLNSTRNLYNKTQSDKILDIAGLYKDTNSFNDESVSSLLGNELNFNTILTSNLNVESFFQILVKNAYHRLDFDCLSDFTNSDKEHIEAYLAIDNRKFAVHFNKETKLLRIKCDYRNLIYVRKFFLKFVEDNPGIFSKKFKELISKKKSLLKGSDSVGNLDFEDAISLYTDLRKLWL